MAPGAGPPPPLRDEQLDHPAARPARGGAARRSVFELDDAELQTTAAAAARALVGKRVLALVDGRVSCADLEGIELVGEGAEAVLHRRLQTRRVEPNQVFSYMNLARAFGEIQLGADLYCLHKNRWWQTSRGPLLDAGAFVAGLEYADRRRGGRARQAEPRRTSRRRSRRSAPSPS